MELIKRNNMALFGKAKKIKELKARVKELETQLEEKGGNPTELKEKLDRANLPYFSAHGGEEDTPLKDRVKKANKYHDKKWGSARERAEPVVGLVQWFVNSMYSAESLTCARRAAPSIVMLSMAHPRFEISISVTYVLLESVCLKAPKTR